MTWKIVARHRGWVIGAVITESDDDDGLRRFTATVRGYRNFRVWQGKPSSSMVDSVVAIVRELRRRIDNGDDTVFDHPQAW